MQEKNELNLEGRKGMGNTTKEPHRRRQVVEGKNCHLRPLKKGRIRNSKVDWECEARNKILHLHIEWHEKAVNEGEDYRKGLPQGHGL
ncbi:hypothetical protein V6N13_126694 [Hibiscus sabdariffa]|uniref:Uncharacterized protein n=1 Tax=Hibiscus sabdariffa TaxID=183260 RepID=A0ABR2RF60_9ROSI